MKKKAQVGIITIILIVLISVILIVILWNLVMPLIKEKAGEQGTQGLFIKLNIEEVILFPTGSLRVILSRTGVGELQGVTFVFDGNGSSASREITNNLLAEGETRTYSFSPIEGMTEVNSVKVIPILDKNTGSQTEFEKIIFEVPEGLVSWWKFENNAKDYLEKNNCELNSGTINETLQGIVNCGNASGLSVNSGMISFWIKTNRNGEIISKGDNYKILFEGGIIKFISAGGNLTGDDRINFIDNQWHHIGIGADGIWVDGIVQNANPVNIGFLGENNLVMGNSNMQLDEVMFFNKSLAISQIQGIYNLQKNKFVESG